MEKKNNNTAGLIDDIKKLTRAGCPEIEIALALTKKYHMTVHLSFIKAIREQYFTWDIKERCYVEDATKERFYINKNFGEVDALEEIGFKVGGAL